MKIFLQKSEASITPQKCNPTLIKYTVYASDTQTSIFVCMTYFTMKKAKKFKLNCLLPFKIVKKVINLSNLEDNLGLCSCIYFVKSTLCIPVLQLTFKYTYLITE